MGSSPVSNVSLAGGFRSARDERARLRTNHGQMMWSQHQHESLNEQKKKAEQEMQEWEDAAPERDEAWQHIMAQVLPDTGPVRPSQKTTMADRASSAGGLLSRTPPAPHIASAPWVPPSNLSPAAKAAAASGGNRLSVARPSGQAPR